MKCKKACDCFSACLDGDLTFSEEAELRKHLRSCARCGSEFAKLEQMVDLLGSLPETDPGPGFYAAVRNRIQQHEESAELETLPGPSLGERLRAWVDGALQPAFLRPAVGTAFGIAVGLFVGTQAPRIVPIAGHDAGSGSHYASVETTASFPGTGVEFDRGIYRSPVADLPLAPVAMVADTVRLEADPEYVLGRYRTDPQGGLVPVDRVYERVNTDNQSGGSFIF